MKDKINYVLTTDSNSEIPYIWEQEHDIKVIYMPYTIQNREALYDLGRKSNPKDFYNLMRSGEKSTTVQKNIEDFREFWTPFLKDEQDILYIGFSSQLSGTFSCATLARNELMQEFPDREIIVVDTLAVSAPLALLVERCAKMRLDGQSMHDVAKWAQENKQRVNAFFTVEDLIYLKRGGRVSGASAFFGTLLEVKPILHLSTEGKLVPIEKIKGRKKALRKIVNVAAQNIEDPQNETIFIIHADALKEAQDIKKQLEDALAPKIAKSIIINEIGPVIGGHAGPGTVAVAFFAKSREITL